jgi:hypothetical protein
MLPQEVFLSHSSADGAFALRLTEILRRHGIAVWYSPTNILGAQQWHDEIGAALDRCDWFLLVLSPNAVESMWVKRELSYALQQRRFENRILPVLYQECDFARISWVLPSIQVIEFSADFIDGCRSLLRVWGLGYQPE